MVADILLTTRWNALSFQGKIYAKICTGNADIEIKQNACFMFEDYCKTGENFMKIHSKGF